MSELECNMPGCKENIIPDTKWCKEHAIPSIEMSHSYDNQPLDRVRFQDCQFDSDIDRGMVKVITIKDDPFGGLPIISEYKKAEPKKNR